MRESSSTKTATLSMSRPSPSGMPSSASATSSSNRSGCDLDHGGPTATGGQPADGCRPATRLAAAAAGATLPRWTWPALLEGLDADQREAVHDRRRPARHPGPGRLGQDAGAHAAASPAGWPTARPTPATCWPSPSPAGPPASCSAASARSACATGRRPARSTAWPGRCSPSAGPTSGRARPELLVDRSRLLGPLVDELRRRAAAAARAGCEDVATEIDWARARLVPPEHYADEAAPRTAAGRRSPPEALGRADRAPTSDAKRRRRLRRLRRPPRAVRPRARPRPGVRRGAALAVPPPVRRRVPGRQPAAVPAARGLARRPARPLRGRRPEPGDLRVERRRPHAARPVPRAGRRGAPSCASPAPTARRPQVVATAAAVLLPGPPRPAPGRRCGPTGRRPEVHAFATEHDEAAGIARLAGRAPARPALVVVRGARPHPRPGRRRSSAALRGGRHPVAPAATTARCSTGPPCRRPCAHADPRHEPLRASSTTSRRRRLDRARTRREPAATPPGCGSWPTLGRASCWPPARRRRWPPSGPGSAGRRRRRRRAQPTPSSCSPSTPPRASSGRSWSWPASRPGSSPTPRRAGDRRRGPRRSGSLYVALTRAEHDAARARGPGRAGLGRPPAPPALAAAGRLVARRRRPPAPPAPAAVRRASTATGRRPADPPALDGPPPVARARWRWPPTCPRTPSAPTPSSRPRWRPPDPDRGRAGRRARAARRPRLAPRLLPLLAECERARAARRSLRACMSAAKTSGSTDDEQAPRPPRSARRRRAGWPRVWILRPSTPVDPAVEAELAVQRRGLAVADRAAGRSSRSAR